MVDLVIMWGDPATPVRVDIDRLRQLDKFLNSQHLRSGDSVLMIINSLGGTHYQGANGYGIFRCLGDRGVKTHIHAFPNVSSAATTIFLGAEIRSLQSGGTVMIHAANEDGYISHANYWERDLVKLKLGWDDKTASSAYSTIKGRVFSEQECLDLNLVNLPNFDASSLISQASCLIC